MVITMMINIDIITYHLYSYKIWLSNIINYVRIQMPKYKNLNRFLSLTPIHKEYTKLFNDSFMDHIQLMCI